MFVQLQTVIVDPDAANRQELATFLSSFGVSIVAQQNTVESLRALLEKSDAPQLVVVNLDPTPTENLAKLGPLPRQFPNTSFFAMSSTLDTALLMESMHLGVKEFIALPIQERKFADAIERVAHAYGMGKRARVINVIPTIGGCGSTTVACNIAASLAKASKTVLIDMDLMRGGVASYFDARPRYTIADVMGNAEKVDRQMLDNALAIHRASGLAILARPELPEDTLQVNHGGVQRLLHVLTRMFDHLVIDSLTSIDPVYSAVIEASDLNVIVMQLNVPSAKNAERFIGAIRRIGVDASKIRVVVNRFVKKGWDIEPQEVERALGLKISWMVPNDFKNAIAAINYGEPVVLRSPRSEMSVSLTGLAAALSQRQVESKAA
jgi:pilus assembly protein CpaE